MPTLSCTAAAAPATSRLRSRALLGTAALMVMLAWFATLGQRWLYDPDEGRYAEIPREMLTGGDWTIPHLNGLVYLEKPPLQYWLTAAAFRLFGESEFTARLCTALAGYGSLLLAFFVGYRLWGLREACMSAGLLAASSLFVLLGHQLTLDMLLSFFLQAALACFLLAQTTAIADPRQGARWMLGCWTAMALGVLTKGLIGILIPAATLLAYAAWQRDFGTLKRLNWRLGLPWFAAITAPWFFLAARRDAHFLQFFFVREHLQRFLTPIEHRSEAWWFFVPVLAVGILPWLPQALLALRWTLRRQVPRGRFDPVRVLWTWSVFVLVFFSLSDAKLIPYILPAIPALAWLCAGSPAARSSAALAISACASLAACIGVTVYASGVFSTVNALPLALALRGTLAATSIVLAATGAGCLALLARQRAPAAFAVVCAGWFMASSTLLVGALRAEQFFSAHEAALALRTAAPTAPLYSVQTYEQSLPFYLGRTLILVDYHDEFTFGLGRDPPRGIDTLQEFSARWQRLAEGFAIMPPRTRDRLRAQGLPLRELAASARWVVVSRR